jgi:hypothetical protein
MLDEKEIDKILIDTLDMDDVEVIQYVFALGYKQCVNDVKDMVSKGAYII